MESTKKFTEFSLSSELLESLNDVGFDKASPIQELTMEPILAGKDVFAQAETGSGKTGAFVIPLIEKFLRAEKSEDSPVRYVVLSPTRELAQQTHKVFTDLGKKAGLESCCVIGGESIDKQKKSLEGHITAVVATPGRLCDLIKQKAVDLSGCEAVVFDEADRLFDMGFQKDIEFILRKAADSRQLIMLSATSNQEVLRTAYKFNSMPEELKLNEDSLLVDHIKHRLAMVSREEKFPLLVSTLRKKEDAYAIVFCNTQVQTHTVAEWLMKMGLKARPISGRLPQNKRTQLLKDFREKKVTILVCTDVAARGLDIKKVNFVVNYDLPQEAASYVHRIGRTGRAGEEGEALSFCAHEDCESLEAIKDYIDADIEKLRLENDDFATDICSKPRIDRKTLRLLDDLKPRHDRGTKNQSRNKVPRKMQNERPQRSERLREEERKPHNTDLAPRAKRIDRRKKEETCYDIKSVTPMLLDYFRITDENLIGHEIIEQGRRKYFLFGARKNKYKFFIKPIFKKILLPFLIPIIQKSGLKVFVKVSYKPNSLFVSFSGADEELCLENDNELLRAFEHLIMVYLQSRIALDRNLKITLKCGKTKIENQRKSDNPRRNKDRDKKLKNLAFSKRKLLLENKEAILLDPLNSHERRIIHEFFQNDEQVKTHSVGEGNLKRVEISLK